MKVGDRIRHGERPGIIDDIPNDRIAWIKFDGSPPDCVTGINIEELSMAEDNSPLASRFNTGKVQFSLIPVSAQTAEAKVWMKGAVKYGRNNWEKGLSFLSVLDSLLRHAVAYQNGETIDPETGEPHMAHVRCNAAMLIEFETTHKELDDRKKNE